jgi:hypothetical protein
VAAIATADGQRGGLFAQHVQPSVESSKRKIGMKRIGRGTDSLAIVPNAQGMLSLADEPCPKQPDAQLLHHPFSIGGFGPVPAALSKRTLNRRADLIK